MYVALPNRDGHIEQNLSLQAAMFDKLARREIPSRYLRFNIINLVFKVGQISVCGKL